MNERNLINEEPAHEIDLKELFDILWSYKIRIILITAIFAAGSVIYALSVPNHYKATALLAPAQSDGGLSSALRQLGGMVSFTGVNLGTGESSESQIAQEIMKSWNFIETFIKENEIAVEVYAVEGWNKTSNKLQINDDLYDTKAKKWIIEDSETNEFRPPTSWELFQRFQKMLSVSEDKATGLVTVSIEYFSPQMAKKWLDIYVKSINKYMQARQVIKVSNNISYLEAQIDKTSIAEMKEVFYTLVEEQTKNKMVAEASPDYTFLPVSQSMVPERKSRPNRLLICIIGTLMGGVLSALLIFLDITKSGRVSTEN